MKKLIRFFIILFAFSLPLVLLANTVIVKGYIKDNNNKAVANKTVKIYSDSSNQSCLLTHTVVTNANGYYIDTLRCESDIRKLKILVESCNGLILVNDPQISTSNIIESNFTICIADTISPMNCHAVFSYRSLTTTASFSGIQFNSAGSEVSNGDSIISRTWIFGDSSANLSGNIIDPKHAYTKEGKYNVCLTIKTKKGCESKFCSTVVFTPTLNNCEIKIQLTNEKVSPKKIRFISNLSSTILGDSIIKRTWKFGDGSSLEGNEMKPLKEYKDTGNFTVCILMKTVKGCEKTFCINVIIRDSIPGTSPNTPLCKAFFSFTKKDSIVHFNSELSKVISNDDSIISRTWYYGDNSNPNSLTGNIINPDYTFRKPGTYKVYLVIKTKKGCESSYGETVVIESTTLATNCKAIFNIVTKGLEVKFNSKESITPSGDSVIQRIWSFGDSSENLIDNRIDPSHKYKKAGNYNACLTIKTKKGCESKYCLTFTLRDSIPGIVPVNCKAFFQYSIKDSIITFNSSGSQAGSNNDSIISRTWYYSDSSTNVSLTGNIITPSYSYSKPGTYKVYLVIKTKNGCESKFYETVIIGERGTGTCKAFFQYSIKDSLITFNSEGSKASSSNDSIISRTWYYNDNATTASTNGNTINPSHIFSKAGTYKVWLLIKTKKGCESKFEATIIIPQVPVPTNCKAQFTFTIVDGVVKFNSTVSNAGSTTDSIINRTWLFGDSATSLIGNLIAPMHTYKKGGTYNVYLYLKTKKGCESKYSAKVVIAPLNCTVLAEFNAVRISGKKVQFNSIESTAKGDSIIQRNWKFGDNTILSGNQINPLKEFPIQGVYKTCLRLKTLQGCEAELCKQVVVQDSTNVTGTAVNFVKIVSINPNPVITRMVITIWSRNNNTEAEISIFDVYGLGKLNIKKTLLQGNNIIEVPTELLRHGPYFLKVSTKNGRDSKAFYKL